MDMGISLAGLRCKPMRRTVWTSFQTQEEWGNSFGKKTRIADLPTSYT